MTVHKSKKRSTSRVWLQVNDLYTRVVRSLEQIDSPGALTAAFTMGACILVLVLVGAWLQKIVPPEEPDLAALAQVFVLPLSEFRPEPAERLQYIVSTFLFIPLCAAGYWAFRRLFTWLAGRFQALRLLGFGWTLLLPVLLVGLTWVAMENVDNFYFQLDSYIRRPKLTAAFFVFAIIAIWAFSLLPKRRSLNLLGEILFFVPALGMIAMLVLLNVFNESEANFQRLVYLLIHLSAYHDSVVQAFLGETILVDFGTQYGLYAAFLSPFFRLFHPPTVFTFSLVMSLLNGLSYFFLLLFLRLALRNRWIALCGFASLFFYTRLAPVLIIVADPYFQYWPHRILFPMTFVLSSWLYLRQQQPKRQRLLFVLNTILCVISLLWNIETGVMVFGAWCFLLVVKAILPLTTREIKKILLNIAHPIGWTVLAVIAGFVLFTLYLYGLSGSWPDWGRMSEAASLFYGVGFYMLPIPGIFFPWALIILCYMVAIYYPVSQFFAHLRSGENQNFQPGDRNWARVIHTGVIGVLGIGLFSYYQGRSHTYSLTAVIWPALILLPVYADGLWEYLKRRIPMRRLSISALFANAGTVLLFGVLFFFLSSALPSIALNVKPYIAVIEQRQAEIRQGASPALTQQIEFIRANTNPSDPVLFLSYSASIWSVYTGFARPVDVPGFGEIALVSDYQKIYDFMDHPPANAKIFWDPAFSLVSPKGHDALRQAGATQAGDLILYIPQP